MLPLELAVHQLENPAWITSSGYVDAMKICARSGSGVLRRRRDDLFRSSGLRRRESALRDCRTPGREGAASMIATPIATQLATMFRIWRHRYAWLRVPTSTG